MLTRETLEGLSNEVLAREYSKICSVRVSSISPDRRSSVITDLLEKLGDSIDVSDIAPDGASSHNFNMTGEQDVSTAQAGKSAVKKAAKKTEASVVRPGKATAADKEPKAAKKSRSDAAVYEASGKECPFREGSMKAKAWAVFAKGGARSAIIEAVVKLGATPATASSWCHTFQKYAASSEVPKPKKASKPSASAKTASSKTDA